MKLLVLIASLTIMGSVAVAQEAEAGSADVSVRDEEARLSFELARRHYERGEFLEAAEAFERSHAYSPRPELLYNTYLSYRDANDDVNAARTLRMYLEAVDETSEPRVVLEGRLAALEAEISSEPEAPVSVVEPAAPDDDEVEPAQGPPIGAIVLTSVGGAALITGVITGIMANGIHNDVTAACPDQTCSDLSANQADIDRGRRFARTTDALLIGGGALVVGGILWWLLGGASDDGSAARQTNVRATCADTGCEFGLQGSF